MEQMKILTGGVGFIDQMRSQVAQSHVVNL
jgi:hypothetical protein